MRFRVSRQSRRGRISRACHADKETSHRTAGSSAKQSTGGVFRKRRIFQHSKENFCLGILKRRGRGIASSAVACGNVSMRIPKSQFCADAQREGNGSGRTRNRRRPELAMRARHRQGAEARQSLRRIAGTRDFHCSYALLTEIRPPWLRSKLNFLR